MMRLNFICLFALFFLVFFGCTQSTLPENKIQENPDFTVADEEMFQQTSETINRENNTTTHSTSDFYLSYPSEWERKDIMQDGIVFIIAAPYESESDPLRENINLEIENAGALSKDAYLSDYMEKMASLGYTIKQLPRSDDFEVLDFDAIDFKDITIKQRQFISIKNGRAFILTYLAQEEAFEKYLPRVNTIVKSFSLK